MKARIKKLFGGDVTVEKARKLKIIPIFISLIKRTAGQVNIKIQKGLSP